MGNKRRETRYRLQVDVQVTGVDTRRRPFSELTKTEDVSEWGCRFQLRNHVEWYAPLALRLVGLPEDSVGGGGGVMFLVQDVKQHQHRWMIGASKIQAQRLWDTETLKAAGVPEVGESDKDKEKAKSVGFGRLPDNGVNALSYGAIQLDRSGRILKYNQHACALACLDCGNVIGKDLFKEVALCLSAEEVYRRFQEVATGRSAYVRIGIELPYKPAWRAQLTMLSEESTGTVWLFLQPCEGEGPWGEEAHAKTLACPILPK